MKQVGKGPLTLLAIIALLSCGLPLAAQYREYYLHGQVQDIKGQPLAGAQVELFEKESSLTFSAKSDADGNFKFAGLPHGIYQVTISKAGYESKILEWKFESPQEKMLRVEIPAIRLASSLEVQQLEENKELKAVIEAASDKIRAQDYDAALGILAKALQRDPKNVNLLYLSGLCLAKKRSFPEAKEALEQVTVLTPDFAPAHFQLGVCYQQTDEKEKALAQYREVMRLDPTNPDCYFNVALILIALNQPAEAMGFCEKVLQARPDDPDINEMAGQCQLQLGDYDKALAFFEKAAGLCKDEAKRQSLNELITTLRKAIKPK